MQVRSSFYRHRILAVVTIIMIVAVVLVGRPQQTNAQFVIAGWEYDDGYGQGIEVVYVHENSTGSWVAVLDPAFVFWYEETTIDLNATPNTALRVRPSANINHTHFNFGPDKSENASARAIMRVGIEVTVAGETVFSLDNLTWEGSVFDDTATTWSISYDVIIDVLLVAGTIYVVRLNYEIFS